MAYAPAASPRLPMPRHPIHSQSQRYPPRLSTASSACGSTAPGSVLQAPPCPCEEPAALASDDPATFRVQPHNIEAEQALLGAILVNNEAYHRVSELLRPEHFFEPVHARIFECCAQRIGRGKLADPVTLKLLFEEDEALRELDGARYLGRLAHAAETIINAAEYGQHRPRSRPQAWPDPGRRGRRQPRLRPGAAGDAAASRSRLAERELFALAQEGEIRGEFRPFPQVLSAPSGTSRAPGTRSARSRASPPGSPASTRSWAGCSPPIW